MAVLHKFLLPFARAPPVTYAPPQVVQARLNLVPVRAVTVMPTRCPALPALFGLYVNSV